VLHEVTRKNSVVVLGNKYPSVGVVSSDHHVSGTEFLEVRSGNRLTKRESERKVFNSQIRLIDFSTLKPGRMVYGGVLCRFIFVWFHFGRLLSSVYTFSRCF
jgi:hypothetical protein